MFVGIKNSGIKFSNGVVEGFKFCFLIKFVKRRMSNKIMLSNGVGNVFVNKVVKYLVMVK